MSPKSKTAGHPKSSTRRVRKDRRRASVLPYPSLLAQAPVPVFLLDRCGRFQVVNEAGLRLLGYTRAELRRRSFRDLCLPECLAATEAAFTAQLNSLQPIPDIEVAVRCKDGSRLDLLVSSGPVVVRGAVVGLFGTARPLSDCLDLWRNWLDSIPYFAWHAASDGGVIRCNRRWYEYTGQTPAEAVGTGWSRAVHPEDRQQVWERLEEALSRGATYRAEYRLRRHDGVYRWHEARSTSVKDPAGRVICWFGAGVDIEDQHLAEEQLRQLSHQLEQRIQERTTDLERTVASLQESEQRFRQLAESMREVFWLMDARTGQFLYLSPAFETIWGLSCTAAYARPQVWLDAVLLQDRYRLPEFDQRHHLGEWTQEYRIRRTDGAIRWIRERGFPVRDAAGRVLRVAGLCEDVTAPRELEQALLDIGDREQRRIGQDLHDSVCQQLNGLAMLCKALEDRMRKRQRPEAEEVREIREILSQALVETRNLAYGLCPGQPEAGNIAVVLSQLAATVERLFRVGCTVAVAETLTDLDPQLIGHLYRIAQEAASNAVRHGNAKQIQFELRRQDHLVTLSIRDDGRGLPLNWQTNRGLGLRTMEYRTRLIGGQLQLGPGPGGGGTLVECSFRLPGPGETDPPAD